MQPRALGIHPLFRNLDTAFLEQLGPLVEIAFFQPGRVIFNQGQFADALYLLERGQVTIHYKPYDGSDYLLVTIHPGEVFGWSSALAHELYSTTAIAANPCQALRVPGRQLQRLCEQHPQAGKILRDRLAEQLSSRQQAGRFQVVRLLGGGKGYNEGDAKR
jgi:CRP/FNR family cyclic AMP-dependent transcriptional regulator